MNATLFSETGALRVLVAIIVAAAVGLTAALTIGSAAAIVTAVVAVMAGLAFESHHLVD